MNGGDSRSPPRSYVIMSSNTTVKVATSNGASHYFSFLAQKEAANRPPNEDRIRGISQ